jgi:TonB family protein
VFLCDPYVNVARFSLAAVFESPNLNTESFTVAVLSFNHELAPARLKGRLAWSLVLHGVAVGALVGLVRWLPPAPEIERRTETVTPLYVPPPPEVETPPVPKLTPPPRTVLAKLIPPKLTVPPDIPKIEPPKIEAKVQPVIEMRMPVPVAPKPEIKKEIVTGAFTTNEVVTPVALKKEVVTDNFASGSSEKPTLQKKAQEVQTGGFGDPNGVKGTSEKKGNLTIASLGGFGLPSGAGQGNGTAGKRGTAGTVASAGFGDGAAGAGQGDHQHQRGGPVVSGGFNEVAAAAPAPKAHTEEKPDLTPVEILYKPRPLYTTEARQIHLEGEVLVRVSFSATGELRVQQVVRGLGHGLDESALRAAQQIKFRPAQRHGQPYDSTALVHIVFELAE